MVASPTLPPGPAYLTPSASVCSQPAASAALYAQLVHGKKGLEAVEALGKLLAHIEQNLSRRGTAYLAGVSGTAGWEEPRSLGETAREGAGPYPWRAELAAACPETEP